MYIEKTTDEEAEKIDSEKIKRIHKGICRIRKSEKVGIKYMQRWEELAYAREDGVIEGRIDGKKEGERKVNRLGVLLAEAGRVADFLKSLSDPDFQRALFVEFGLEKN